MRYWPNPAHKKETSEAGPPRWWPDKEPCPDDLSVRERNELLASSVAVNPSNPRSRRFAIRRGRDGLEVFDAKWTRDVNDEPEFHGHPATFVPARVLREFRNRDLVTAAEFRKLVKNFGCI